MLSLSHLQYILWAHILYTYIPEFILTIDIFDSFNKTIIQLSLLPSLCWRGNWGIDRDLDGIVRI